MPALLIPGRVECREGAVVAPQKAVTVAGRIHVAPHDFSGIVDPEGHRPERRVVARHVERGEDAVFPDEAMPFLGGIPVGSRGLPLRVDEPALRPDRSGIPDPGSISV